MFRPGKRKELRWKIQKDRFFRDHYILWPNCIPQELLCSLKKCLSTFFNIPIFWWWLEGFCLRKVVWLEFLENNHRFPVGICYRLSYETWGTLSLSIGSHKESLNRIKGAQELGQQTPKKTLFKMENFSITCFNVLVVSWDAKWRDSCDDRSLFEMVV